MKISHEVTEIIRMQFGSHVYGTNVETSDKDYKGVFLPSQRGLILGMPEKHINNSTKKDNAVKNSSTDVDFELFSISNFLKLIVEGQTGQIDMLFVPEKFYTMEPHPLWLEIMANRDKLIHSKTSAFVGYCHQQAAKYGLKGSRISCLRKTIKFLSELDPHGKLWEFELGLKELVKPVDIQAGMATEILIEIIGIPNKKFPDQLDPHLSVCDRKVPFNATVKYAIDVYQKILDNYGARALAAEKNEGVDWKAVMHATRVCGEATELLLTGKITFPRPDAHVLLLIRKGLIPYKDVEKIIEAGLATVKAAEQYSVINKKPDHDLIEKMTINAHLHVLKNLT